MKFRRLISGLLFAAGCVLLFISLLAYALVYSPSPQLALIRESFYVQSDHLAVQLMNRAMQFALIQHWQTAALGILVTAAGILLMNHFSPKRQAPAPASSEEGSSLPRTLPEESQPQAAPEKSNPFAVNAYNHRIQHQKAETKPVFPLKAEPILERNSVEPVEPSSVTAADESEAPYISYRFPVESRAVEAEPDTPSQSGSWILTRNVPDEEFWPTSPPEVTVSEPFSPASIAAETDSMPETSKLLPEAEPTTTLSSPSPSASPLRIRSTMGRHGNRKTNLS